MQNLQVTVGHFVGMVGMMSWASPFNIQHTLYRQPAIFLDLLREAGFGCDELETHMAEYREKEGPIRIYNPHSNIRVWQKRHMNCRATAWLDEAVWYARQYPEDAKSILLEEIKCRASNPDRIPPHFTEHQFYVLGSEPTLIAA